ncbi:54S ribosomal protein L25, mitochondrial [Tulasnella sp. JGI-2019a]|nr:54S ribosomal protein L25, mitochondrial [Tulasnella sp. JGI-2019a]KAG9006997.1 54S ribosomal protein L25, mitochondrial [Tulasnella sp. JGI-2019a]KAG9034248.1 54S ribosomal protein L25, mitochondrial [Tulasnella sp. JGI-2019a]
MIKPISSTRIARFLYREGVTNGATSSSSVVAGSSTSKPKLNPFLPHLSPQSGKWIPPRYSLRRQSDLVKEATRTGTSHLLPPGLKNPVKQQELTVRVAESPSSAILAKLNAAKMGNRPPRELKVLKEQGVLKADTEQQRVRPEWVGEPKEKKSFGLYGKRRVMFKGHKWQKSAKLRRETMEKVVSQVDTQKRNMRYGRFKKAKMPRSKYPI